jgi:hypothetical protein
MPFVGFVDRVIMSCNNLQEIPWIQKVAMGLVPGWSSIEKFGENSSVQTTGPEDIWSQGGLYTYSSSTDIDQISSSSALDTQTITIIGQTLDNTEVKQQAVLNGQNKVALATPLFRVYRAYNVSGTDLAGDVYIYVDGPIVGGVPSTIADIRAKIATTVHPIPPNQTEMALYTVPKGKQGFFYSWYLSMNNIIAGNFATFVWRLRYPGEVFRVQSRIACIGAGDSHWTYTYPFPSDPIPAGSDIAISVDFVDSNNTQCAGGFTVALQDMG